MLFVIANADGSMQRIATTPLEPAADQSVIVFNDRDTIPDPAAEEWNPATLVFDEIVQAGSPSYARTKLTKREFRARLGQTCRIGINARLITPPTSAAETQLVAALQDLKDELLSVDFVELTHPSTVLAVGFLTQIGFLTAAEATAVLAPSTVAEE